MKRKIRFSPWAFIQILLLYGLSEAGSFIVSFFHIPLPGNLVGMLILFLLLMMKIIPLHWLEAGSSLLLKHLSLFFIPISVGLMNYGRLFLHQGWIFFLLIMISLWIGIFTSGGVSQFFVHKKSLIKEGNNRGECK